MKKCSVFIVAFLAVCLIGSNSICLQAQTYIPADLSGTYSDPMPNEHAAIPLTKEAALSELALNQAEAGFTKAFITAKSIQELLNRDPAVVGIRIYNGLETRNASMANVIAVPVRADYSEVREGMSTPYLESTGFSGPGSSTERQLSLTEAKARVSNLKNSGSFESFSAFFSKTALLQLLAESNVTGLNFFPSDNTFALDEPPTIIETHKTFMAAGTNEQANAQGANSEGLYLQSPSPCPPVCGTGNEYLNNGW